MITAIDDIGKIEAKIRDTSESIDGLNEYIRMYENEVWKDVFEAVKLIKTNEKERQIMYDDKVLGNDDLQQAYAQRRNLMHILSDGRIEHGSLMRAREDKLAGLKK